MADLLSDDPLTDEDVASAGAVLWAELPEAARARFRVWLSTSEAGPAITATAGGDMDYALWLAGSVLRCGINLDDDHRVKYGVYRAAFDDPRSPRNLFKTLALAVAELDAAPSGIAGDERNEAGIDLRDAAVELLAGVTAAGSAELWWREALLRCQPAEPDAGDASDMYTLSVFGLTVSVHLHELPDVVDGGVVAPAGGAGHGPMAHVLIETEQRTDRRVLVGVDEDYEHLHNDGS